MQGAAVIQMVAFAVLAVGVNMMALVDRTVSWGRYIIGMLAAGLGVYGGYVLYVVGHGTNIGIDAGILATILGVWFIVGRWKPGAKGLAYKAFRSAKLK